MGRVWVGIFHTQARPTGLPLKPGPSPFNKRVFMRGLDPSRWAPRALPAHATSGPNQKGKKKKKMSEA